MYLNAIFVINDDILKELNTLNPAKRLKYILGNDGIDNFAKQLIDMEDYYETTNIFYNLLISKDFNLSELNAENMNCLYNDGNYTAYYIEGEQLENLYKKVSIMTAKNIRNGFAIHETKAIDMDLISPVKKFERLGALISVAINKKVPLLLILQIEV